MSHGLLLRLFLSPSFFSVHVALKYLMTYSDNVGITYYLTRRLREFTIEELSDVWGFICHLLVSRPSKSRALECFVSETAGKSTHIAMLTLWFMQSSLRDLDGAHNRESFLICQRTLLMCHELIFGDLPPPVITPYPSLLPAPQRLFALKKVKSHAPPAIVGISLVLAGAPGLPQLTEVMGEVAIEQGRIDDQGTELKSLQRDDDDYAMGGSRRPSEHSTDDDEEPTTPTTDEQVQSSKNGIFNDSLPPITAPAPLPRRRSSGPAQTTPSLPLHVRRKPRFSDDPLGQLDASVPAPSPAAFQSSPALPTGTSFRRSNSLNPLSSFDALLSKYDLRSQVQLLRSHFCRSEVQFILNLENISNRLLVVPRPARVSALRAELTALNHKLPAEVCMPMWCTCTDAVQSGSPREIPSPHHRIVRIPPGECVVLNSAERAPYLLLIEVLNGDLDFDPAKRGNKEILQKIVAKENERKGGSRDLIPFGDSRRAPSNGPLAAVDTPELSDAPFLQSSSLHSPSDPSPGLADDEEIDLVEQLYGPDESLRSRNMDLSDSIVLPPPLKNKDLDIAAWSRASSIPPSPSLEHIGSPSISFNNSASSALTPNPLQRTPSQLSQPFSPTPTPEAGAPIFIPAAKTLSLEDYSERMRTAAVMLAQLNSSLVWDANPTTAPNVNPMMMANPTLGAVDRPSEPSSLSNPLTWLPGTNWFSVTPPTPMGNGPTPIPAGSGPVHPSLAPNPRQPHTSSSAPRMKLQPSEAAAIRDRIMKEMLALEEERMQRMVENRDGEYSGGLRLGGLGGGSENTAEDESIIRKELNKVDPSAVVFSESWAAKKARVRHGSPYGHLASWDCLSVIVKTGGDLRQEQLATQLIHEFKRIWQEENCQCWARHFHILITGGSSGLVETITDAVSIHSIKKAEYARRLKDGGLGHVTLMDHFKNTYGDPSSAKFARAQRNFAKSLAGYSIITYLLQIKDRHNGNILLDRDGHLIHIDFGFMLSNSPGNIGFEAAPFKLPLEYVEVLGGVDGEPLKEFRRLFGEGFEAARKHCDRIITMVELMQKDSTMPCFAAFGEQTAVQLRERFQQALTHSLVAEHVDRLIDTSLGSNWTRLYDSYQYYSQSILS